MPFEAIVSIAATALGLVNAWLIILVQGFRRELDHLRSTDTTLGERLAAIQVLVAGQYITRQEFTAALDAQTKLILGRMDQIAKLPIHLTP